jgi:hypothetical protein
LEVLGELVDIMQVGIDGIGREGSFQLKPGFITFFVGFPHAAKIPEKIVLLLPVIAAYLQVWLLRLIYDRSDNRSDVPGGGCEIS